MCSSHEASNKAPATYFFSISEKKITRLNKNSELLDTDSETLGGHRSYLKTMIDGPASNKATGLHQRLGKLCIIQKPQLIGSRLKNQLLYWRHE